MKIKVGLVQVNNSFSGQSYFPYSIGLLQAYAQKHLKQKENFEFLLPIYSRIKVQSAVEHLMSADIILFSAYVWNYRISLKIAEIVKARRPEVVIVFGGPHVPDNAEAFLRQNTFVDIAGHKEGESIICPLLENFQEGSWAEIPSISYINKDDKFVQNTWAQRIRDLSQVPSPYLEGVFEPLMQANPEEKWLVMWETNRGCPFSCTFCDWGSATQAKVNKFDLDRLFQELDWVSKNKIEFIFCCDANFGILPRDLDIAQHAVKNKLAYGYPHALSVQNTKNARDRAYKVQKLLADYGLNKGVTLSLQSTDEETLKNVKRDNISLAAYKDLQHRFTRDKIETYSDMILGMPGETYDSFLNGIEDVISNGQHNRIQFGNLTILPNTEMGNPAYREKFGMQCVETKIINIHGSLLNEGEVAEYQKLVVATHSMPQEDWLRTRSACWMASFLYFNKVMQIPFVILNRITGIGYRELIEAFISDKVECFPVLSDVKQFFLQQAEKVQQGGAEYSESKKWLNIWWPADELQLIHLCTNALLEEFYKEAELLLKGVLKEKMLDLPERILSDSIKLNKNLIKHPFQTHDLELVMTYNIWDVYSNYLIGVDVPLLKQDSQYVIVRTEETWETWDEWCQQVIWYGNKKGAYLYKVRSTKRALDDQYPTNTQVHKLAGHH